MNEKTQRFQLLSTYACMIGYFVIILTITSCTNTNDANVNDSAINNKRDLPLINSQSNSENSETVDNPAELMTPFTKDNEIEPLVEIDLSTSKSKSFSVSSSSSVLPIDILYEIAYSGGAGGPGYWCESHIPTIGYGNVTGIVEWTEQIKIVSCGWQPDERVDIFLKKDTGEVILEESVVAIGMSSEIVLDYTVPPNTPHGHYTVVFSGSQNQSIEQPITILKPSEPRLYGYDNKLLLYNFQPYENVWILYYDWSDLYKDHEYDARVLPMPDWNKEIKYLLAWESYQVSSGGDLVIQPDRDINTSNTFIARGDLSGIVSLSGGRGGDINSPFDIAIQRPTTEHLESIPSIWQLITYPKLDSPGIQTHTVSVDASSQWQWDFLWCATSSGLLEENLQFLTVAFIINNIQMSFPQLRYYDKRSQDGQACRRWVTLLRGWSENMPVKLEIQYTLTESVYNGDKHFPSGTYRQVLIVNTKE